MEHKVFQLHCLIRRAGKTAHHHADLIFIDAKPYVVIEWLSGPGFDHPDVKVELDPKHLTKIHSGKVDYMYAIPIEDTRALH